MSGSNVASLVENLRVVFLGFGGEASTPGSLDLEGFTLNPSHLLNNLVCNKASEDNWVGCGVEVPETLWWGDNEVSVSVASEGLSSPVEDEPLFGVISVRGTSDSQFVLAIGSTFSLEESQFLETVVGLKLEFDSISEWVSSNLETFSVDEPALVGTISTGIVDNVVMVVVLSTVSSKAEASWVSDVLLVSWPDSSALELLVSPLSDDNSNLWTEFLSLLVGKSSGSVSECSDRSSS